MKNPKNFYSNILPHKTRLAFGKGKRRLVLINCLILLNFAGCQSTGNFQPQPTTQPRPVTQVPEPVVQDSPEQLLQRAERSSGEQKYLYLIKAAAGFLNSNDFMNAESLLQTIEYNNLSYRLQGLYLSIHAELLLINRQYPEAAAALSTDKMGLLSYFDNLEPKVQQAILIQRARAHEALGQYLAATKARVFASANLKHPADIVHNNDLIWRNLSRIDLGTLQSLELNMPDTQLRGWVELASAIQQQQGSLQQQLKTVQNWQARWPGHIGQRFLPKALAALDQAVEEQPRKIALLLPSSGRLARATAALRDGFMAAYYNDLNAGLSPPQIIVIDTNSSQSMSEIYAKIQNYGVDLVIGPLEKKRVQELAAMGELPVPTLSLNYASDINYASDNHTNHDRQHNFFQFGLAAEDEAIQIAQQAALSGYHTGAIIFPETDWGERVRQAFDTTWANLNGMTASTVSFTKDDDYGTIIKQAMEIDHSQNRAKALRATLGQKIEFTPRRRQDIQFLVLLGNPNQARQLKPALNFYFAGDLPIFSTSNVYTGTPSPNKDKDLNGIVFTEMPWLFSSSNFNSGLNVSPEQTSFPRLFALGADAYALSFRLRLLRSTQDAAHQGLTGRLSLNHNGRIQREAIWIKFTGGSPKPINMDNTELDS